MNFEHKRTHRLVLLLCLVLLLSCLSLPALAAAKPTLSHFVLYEKGQILLPGDTVTLSVEVSSVAEIVSVTARLTGPKTHDISLYYNEYSALYEGEYEFTDTDINGEYTVRYITAKDVNGNTGTLTNPSGYVSLTDAQEDPEAPELYDFQLREEERTLLPGEAAHFTATVYSNSDYAVSEVRVTLTGAKTLNVFLSKASGSLWKGSYTLDEDSRSGSYTVSSILVKDTAGHSLLVTDLNPTFYFYSQKVETIELNYESAELTLSTTVTRPTLQLLADVGPASAANLNVVWTSSNKKVATVSKSGFVTGRGAGECTITCTAADGSGVSAKCVISVVHQKVENIKLNYTEKAVVITAEATHPYFNLSATVTPKEAIDRSVTWTSGDPEIATVNSRGHVVCLQAGFVEIYCTANDGSGVCEICAVTITRQTGEEIFLTKSGITMTLAKGQRKAPSYQLRATILPETAAASTLVWKSNRSAVASVSKTGLVTAGKKAGTAVITCYLEDDPTVSATCTVTVVKKAITGISLSKKKVVLTITRSQPNPRCLLTVKTYPSDAYAPSLYWISSDESVATVSPNGVVQAVGQGLTYITCSTADGTIKATCRIVVMK